MNAIDNQLLESIGNHLKALRENHGLTAEEVMAATRLPVEMIEAGQKDIPLDKLNILCEYYNLTLFAFFKAIEERTP